MSRHSAAGITASYSRLGISTNATLNEVKTAYKQLAKTHHPDVVAQGHKAQAEVNFKQISQAYNHIVDAPKDWRSAQQGGGVRPGIQHPAGNHNGLAARALSPTSIALFFAGPVIFMIARVSWSYYEHQALIAEHTGRKDGLLNPTTSPFLAEQHKPKVKSSPVFARIFSFASSFT